MREGWRDRFRLNQPPEIERIPTFAMGDAIPKLIHQTYHAPPWPEALEANRAHLERTNPGWTYRFHDYEARRTFISETYGPAVLALYDAIDPAYGAARADLFRYLLLYREGGLYLDMKSSTDRPLDTVIRPDDVYLLSAWRTAHANHFGDWGRHAEVAHLPFGEYQQWFIATAPGHPFLKAVIERVLRNIARYVQGIHGSGAFAVLRVTGPVAYTLAIEPLRATVPHRLVDSREDLGLVYSVFDRDASRTHEKIFPHYSTLARPMVRSGPVARLFSLGVNGPRRLYRRLKGKRG